MINDTIAAIASGLSASGIGIVRISGPEAFDILKKIFVPRKGGDPLLYPTHTVHLGHIASPEGGSAVDINSVFSDASIAADSNSVSSGGAGDPGLSRSSSGGAGDPGLSRSSSCGAGDPGLSRLSSCGAGDPGLSRSSSGVSADMDPDSISSREPAADDPAGSASEGRVLDECLVTVMRAPNSYTTEDVVEINCHGGIYVMRRVLDLVISCGARPAEPGEFTKRAFLGGRIDLSEAEAVMDVIRAGSEDALASSLKQLGGSVGRAVSEIREKLIHQIAAIEASIDDPEHLDISGSEDALLSEIREAKGGILRLIETFGRGNLIREGIYTVIAGKPNVGKSSLLNAITGGDRAIVTEIEGTTRDLIEETVEIGGLTLRLADTAGIRSSEEAVEKIGIDRAREAASSSDLILAVFDLSRPLDENDADILSLISDKKALIILNKKDLAPCWDEADLMRLASSMKLTEAPDNSASAGGWRGDEDTSTGFGRSGDSFTADLGQSWECSPADLGQSWECSPADLEQSWECSPADLGQSWECSPADHRQSGDSSPGGWRTIRISASHSDGTEDIAHAVRELFMLGEISRNEETLITHARHADALKRAAASLSLAESSIESGMPEDFISIDLMDAASCLGEITGEDVSEEVINTIFSDFCMGK